MKAGEKFKISDDGTIYSLNDDGSISTIGRIVDGKLVAINSSLEEENNQECSYCHGKGIIETNQETIFGTMVSKKPCPLCGDINNKIANEFGLSSGFASGGLSMDDIFKKFGDIFQGLDQSLKPDKNISEDSKETITEFIDTSNLEFIDLGIGLLWSAENICLSSGKRHFSWDDAIKIQKRVTSGRLPTINEVQNLLKKCKWNWGKRNGVNVMMVIGSNGKSIVLPTDGYSHGDSIIRVGKGGNIWTSSTDSDKSLNALSIGFDRGNLFDRLAKPSSFNSPKKWQLSIRLVKDI
ncbi:MAG: hypothetical protein NC453_10760 [Muribaculum sp.]|nr:hypothetical protein [Muribaculum sp.]